MLGREFSEDHLLCLLCMIGEFDVHAPEVVRLLSRNISKLQVATRTVLALEALHLFARGERFDRSEWSRRLSAGGWTSRELKDLPESVRSALEASVPGGTWDLIMMTVQGHEVGGKDAAGKPVYAYFSSEGRVMHVEPKRRRGEATDPSVFSETLAAKLALGSRSSWALVRACSEEHLLCLLWLVGEFAARAPAVLRLLDENRSELVGADRAILALHAMFRMVHPGERFDVAELERRIGAPGAL